MSVWSHLLYLSRELCEVSTYTIQAEPLGVEETAGLEGIKGEMEEGGWC